MAEASSDFDLLGIEIGGTKLQVVRGDARGSIFKTAQASSDATGGGPAILRQLEAMVRQLLPSSPRGVQGIGIGFGGPVDAASGTVIKSNQVAGWERVSLRDWSAEQFQLPCTVANDTDAAAIAEARVGGGRNDRCVFYTNIGSGIGGGLVVDGQLYDRPHGAMEVGHHWVYSELDQRHGILEDFCSGWSLNRRARDAARHDQGSMLWQLADGDESAIDGVTLFEAWQQGDRAATRVVDCFLECYALTMSNVIALLNPDVVIIGGGVAQVGTHLLEAIRAHIEKLIYQPFADTYRLELTSLGTRAVPVGALLLAADGRL